MTKFKEDQTQNLEFIKSKITNGNTERLKYLFQGFQNGITNEEVVKLSNIHPWFVHKLRSTFDKFQAEEFSYFEDGNTVYKMVDTCAGEFEAYTPFFYSTQKISNNLLEEYLPDKQDDQNEAQDFLYNQEFANFDYLIDQAARDNRELIVDAVIFNSFNKVFVQKRRSDRTFLPNCWGIVGGHYNKTETDTIFRALEKIIFQKTGWHLKQIRSLLEIRDWEHKGIRKRTIVFDVKPEGNVDIPVLDMTKVKGFLWIDEADLQIFDSNKSFDESLMFSVCQKALQMHNNPKKVIILGSGPIRIGQGVEFDYLTVHAVRALQKRGIKAIIINNNPETVSTDYSTSDRLYFEPMTPEFVKRVIENEKEGLVGVIAQFGGQTAINLAKPLSDSGVQILGTNANAIDLAEDRQKTGFIMQNLGLNMPQWGITYNKSEVIPKAKEVGFPVLIRPSFVLGGDGMKIVYSESEVKEYLDLHFGDKPENFEFDKPILVDKFLDNAVEIDIDFITDGKKTYCFILEQLDKAGVHSGDSSSVFPVQNISLEIQNKLVSITQSIAKEFQVLGIGNLQVAIKDNQIYIIEVNPRASRTIPFISKCLGFSLAEMATNVIMGDKLPEFDFDLDYYKNPEYAWTLKQEKVHKEHPIAHIAPKFVAIKHPVFCLHKLPGVNPELGPLMKSTGEAMTVGKTFEEAKAKWSKNNNDQSQNVEVYCL